MDRGELLSQSRQLCERGLLSAAADILSEYLRGHTEDAQAFRELAQVRIQQGRQDWAASLLKRAALIEESAAPPDNGHGAEQWDADDLAFAVARAERHEALRDRHLLEDEAAESDPGNGDARGAADVSAPYQQERILHLPAGVTPRRRAQGGGIALPRSGGICRPRPSFTPEASPAPVHRPAAVPRSAPEADADPPGTHRDARDDDSGESVAAEGPDASRPGAAQSGTPARPFPEPLAGRWGTPEPESPVQMSLDEDWRTPGIGPEPDADAESDLDELDDLWNEEGGDAAPDAPSLDVLGWLDELPDDELEAPGEEDPLFDVDSGGTRITDWDKVRRLTADALRNSGRTEPDLQPVLEDIFQESPWPRTRLSVEDLLRRDLSAEALSLATEIRRIWRRHPEFAQCFYASRHRGEAWMFTEQARSVLSWPGAARMAEAWSAYPCPEEVEHFLREAWDHWRSDPNLLEQFPDFQLYASYRLGHLDRSLKNWPEWTFEPDHALEDPWLRLDDPEIWAEIQPDLGRLGVRLPEPDYRPPPRKLTVPASKIESAEGPAS